MILHPMPGSAGFQPRKTSGLVASETKGLATGHWLPATALSLFTNMLSG